MKNIFKITILIALLGLVINGCTKIQTIHPAPLPEEGMYLVGSSVKTDTMVLEALLSKTQVETASGHKYSRDSLYYKFFYATAAGDGFSIKEQVGDKTISWGMDGSYDTPEKNVYIAKLSKEGKNFAVPEEGTYLFAIDLVNMKAYLFKINQWQLKGKAIHNIAPLTVVDSSKDSTSWANEKVAVSTGTFVYQFYKSKVYLFEGDTVGLPMYLGSSVTAPEYAGDPISVVADLNNFSFKLKYDFLNGFSATTSLPPYDPRTHVWSLIGDAFYQKNDPNNSPTAWDVDFDFKFDAAISDTLNGIYKFVIKGQYFIGGKEFKIRADHEWAGLEMGYNDVNGITGDVSNISNAGGQYGNFKVGSDAQYDVTFTYDAIRNKKYIDFTKTQK